MRKKKICSMIAVLLAVVMGMLAGCGNIKKFDAGVYTKSCLDAMYKGEFDEYIKLTQLSEEEAQDDYEENIESLIEEYEDMGLSEELLDRFESLYAKILKKAKYSIKEVKEDKDKNYTVDVEIEPMRIFEGIGEETMVQVQKYVTDLAAAGTEPTDEELNEKIFQVLYEVMSERIENITYNEPKIVTVKVTKADDNVYEISEEDYVKMDEAMYDIDKFKFE